ncbi:hypothetical protein Tco_0933270 [Tanacetum coccineum]
MEVGSIRRIQGLDMAYWGFLGVRTTLDIFQNIHILYLRYGVLKSSGYGVLSFIPLWSLSQKDARIASIMDSLCLDVPFAETLEVSWLQPAYEQLLLSIHRKEDNAIIGETSLSDSLNVVHDRVQKVKEGDLSYRLSISEVMGPLVDPLSSENLVGEASTSRVLETAATTTALSASITTANVSSIPPISVADYEVLNAEPRPEASHSPKIIYEEETLETSREYPTTS